VEILISAGGTSERIDNVRSITNGSTGLLGRHIAEAFAATGRVGRIWYVCGRAAAAPAAEIAEIVRIGDVSELIAAVRDICGRRDIGAAVHAMAVSDYAVSYVSSAAAIAESVERRLALAGPEGREAAGGLRRLIEEGVADAAAFGRDGKIPSDVDDLAVFLRRAPKVLPMLRGMAPGAVIVGFKLLDGAAREALMDAARRLLRDSGCDFVLANDLAEISGERHPGYLLGGDGSCLPFGSKAEIAEGIARAVMEAAAARAYSRKEQGG
jgi:phosphopantothenate-cysteine ligase